MEFPFGKLGGYTIPNSVTRIESSAFYACTSLTSLTIPNSVTSIGDSAFFYSGLTSVTIPNSVTNIGDYSFEDCHGLTSVSLGSGITSIGNLVFAGCFNLTSITIPNSVANIGYRAFYGCFSLISVTLGSGITSIGDGAFEECSWLTSVYFQGNAPSFGRDVFWNDYHHPTIYHLPGTIGWGSTFALWTLPYPLILTGNPSFGVRSNQFGFTVSWATNLFVVVEASTDLKNPNWLPLTTNAVNNGVVNFTDPDWTNYPSRFYRVRSQ